mgnify:CR=1 FL=1
MRRAAAETRARAGDVRDVSVHRIGDSVDARVRRRARRAGGEEAGGGVRDGGGVRGGVGGGEGGEASGGC